MNPVSCSEEPSHLVCNPKGSIRDVPSVLFLKLNTMDAIWLTIMNNQLSCRLAPAAGCLIGNHELLPRWGRHCGGASSCPLTQDLSEVNRVFRSMEPLGHRSYECFSAESWLLEFSDPLARVKVYIDEIIYLPTFGSYRRLWVRACKNSKSQVSLTACETVGRWHGVTQRTEQGR